MGFSRRKDTKVKLRHKVRGLRSIERKILTEETNKGNTLSVAEEGVLDYCSAIRGILNSNQGSPEYPSGLRMFDRLKQVRESLQINIDLKRDTPSDRLVNRLAKCIDRGFERVEGTFEEIGGRVEEIRAIGKTVNPETGNSEERQKVVEELRSRFAQKADPISQHMAKIMERFQKGLFAGGDDLDIPQDNLEEERWFKKPKSHERRITGRRHAGTRIVREGATMMPALDAHVSHPKPFSPEELWSYCTATVPESQKAAIHRRKVMRKAGSRKKLMPLLTDLEQRYLTDS